MKVSVLPDAAKSTGQVQFLHSLQVCLPATFSRLELLASQLILKKCR